MPARKKFTVLFQNEALEHLQKNIDYYNLRKHGLGKRFGLNVKRTAKQLEHNPFYQIRYDDICCLPILGFPFMMHFSVNEALKQVRIFAVLHTSLDPNSHWVTKE
jgi:hypothetical protein